LTYFALTGGFMFVLTTIIVLLRVLYNRLTPAIGQDPKAIVSLNQALKNVIIYNAIFMGLYYYLSQNWKK